MTNRKTTKKALYSSIVALLLCFTMLLGTTFAWFTDSASSGNNIIKTGNLDMKLSYKPYGAENTEWTEVTESTVLFGENALYEPGYTEAVWLKVENLGSLAFRYDLAINVANEKQGTNKDGDKFSLSDYLEVKYMTTTSTDMESSFYTTRESLDSFAWGSAANSGVASLSDDIAVIKNGVAYSKDDAENSAWSSAYVLVVISMPTSVTNVANHNGTDIPQIDFSLTAVATQLAYEKDSFGSDYDKDAEYPVITVDKPYFSNYTATEPYTVDGEGKTVVGVATSADVFTWTDNYTIPEMSNIFASGDKSGAKVTVNNITFTGTMSAVMAGRYVDTDSNWFNTEFNNVNIVDAEVVSFSGEISPALAVYGNLTMNNCKVTGTTLSELDTYPMWPVYDMAIVNGSTTVVNDSEIGSINMWAKANITLNNSTVDNITVRGNMNTNTAYGIYVGAGSTVDTIDLTAVTNVEKVNITVAEGGSVRAYVDSGVEYTTLDAWKAAQ